MLFEGEPEEVRFVTSAPPLTLDDPVAPFHAVVLGRKGQDALRLIERLVPSDEPFAPGPERVLSRSVTRFSLAYRDETGAWQERWDGREARGLPTAVRLELAVAGLVRATPALVVALPMESGPRDASLASHRTRSDAGVALMVVLLLLALLLTIVAEFAQAMRLEAVTATNFRSSLAETWRAEAGYQRALAEILPDALTHELDAGGALLFRRTRLGIPTVPERLDLRIDPGRFSYRITDEGARLNLNRATRDVLDRLLQVADVEKTERDVIVDSILDWRDPNEEHRLNGAESDYYLGLAVPYRSKNADFDSVDELLQVRGVTRALLYGRPETPGLAEYLTVFGTSGVNVNTASPVVLRALGFAPAEVELLIGRRPYADPSGLPPGLRRGNPRVNSDTFRIEAWAGGAEPAGRVLTAIVERQTGTGQIQAVPRAWRWSEVGATSSVPAPGDPAIRPKPSDKAAR